MKIDDIYILVDKFSNEKVYFFINKYLSGLEPLSQYYEYPPYSGKTEFETENYQEMLVFILKVRGRYFRFYFKNPSNDMAVKFGMIFFNEDGSLILGLSISSDYIVEYENKMKEDFNSQYIMIVNEISPPNNSSEFKQWIDQIQIK
jgi:hypothetical protein